jgi:two-component system sensor histidine kinase KdpD
MKLPESAGYAWALLAMAACTAAGLAMTPRFDVVNVGLVYALGVVLVALRYPRGPAVFASIVGVSAFDFLFVPPQGTFTVDDAQSVLTFAMILAIALVISGLVERVRRQERERAALALQAETERIRSVLLASISHDLRTPLTVLTGASSSLAASGERMSAGERRALAKSVFEQSREISEHVAKILQMTRLETGAMTLDRDWTSLREIAASVLDRMAERMSAHRLLVEIPEELPLLRVDAALVEQALGNLLENAAKHTPPGTVVRLSAEKREAELLVTVQDYAAGSPPRDLERVFEKFHGSSTEGAGGGMGLGLAICRAIVRLHGGRAWAERIPAGGTAFHFSLPLEAAPSVPAEAAEA